MISWESNSLPELRIAFSIDSSEIFMWPLTPELSRPVAGRRTRASVAQSTWPMPRHGVGLNELLGAREAGESETLAHLPKAEAGRPERALENLQTDVSEATASVVGKLSTPLTVSEAGQRDA